MQNVKDKTLRKPTTALRDIDLSDYPKIATGLLSHLDRLLVPPPKGPISEGATRDRAAQDHDAASRARSREEAARDAASPDDQLAESLCEINSLLERIFVCRDPRVQNNLSIYILTRTDYHISAFLTKALQFLHETALIFEPLLSQAAILAETFLKLSVREEVGLDPIEVIDVFGPGIRWRKIICSDHSVLEAIVKEIDADVGSRRSMLPPLVETPRLLRKRSSRSPQDGSQLTEAEADDSPSRSAGVSAVSTSATPSSVVSAPVSGEPTLAQFARDACVVQVLFLLMSCCEEITLKCSLDPSFSIRVLRMLYRLVALPTSATLEEYEQLWLTENRPIKGRISQLSHTKTTDHR
ncbi:hypothetical protein GNI_171000 [Gregarina niphandrodes]|uniref:Uncharacterized protein n=1 Tax=Gregarina niphandrodes TaxID=110365 RepID=A0A023AYF1_GRENI|nr:hypothetical protein GNI_171000 [Gregarina niphandrodes]EZG43458.1 hypothetical protein GNI_171000 [Gregarina niphandrodes]|eukprot:XP_011133309.1 hypothetical protein GNI_171000 [Gregarina niphandrodes]